MKKNKYQKVLLTRPNFSWFGKRPWKLIPYNLGLLNASLRKASYDSQILDPNLDDMTIEEVRREIIRQKPQVVGISASANEHLEESKYLAKEIKKVRPETVIIMGGIVPTMMPERVTDDPNVDFLVMGEGEIRVRQLLDQLNSDKPEFDKIDGLIWGRPRRIQDRTCYIEDLDSLDPPDYTGIDPLKYSFHKHRYAHYFYPRQFPFWVTITSRGCPHRCIFCAGRGISGRRVRLRSADNVLNEVEMACDNYGIKEFIFLDDHFLAKKKRALEIMQGLKGLGRGLTWKCANVNVQHLDQDLLEAMKDSGCYQLTISIESGTKEILKLAKKPINLERAPRIITAAKKLGFEIASNFIIGFPGETWDQIRQTCRYADSLDLDLAIFHIATPLPKTELMELSLKLGCLKEDEANMFGYCAGAIETPEFTAKELQVIRAFEWDRINFSSQERKETIARMEGITMAELEKWRRRTRLSLGVLTELEEKAAEPAVRAA